ncbi:MAG: HDOD domain-containing protein [Rhodocyclales bacterium]|nr:HDOD domain-containing protein [Rhodocyclales bacterium]
MNQPPEHASLLMFELLAERNGKLAALRLDFVPPEPTQLLELLRTPAYGELTREIPCLLDADPWSQLAPELQSALRDAGCEFIAPAAVHRTDTAPQPNTQPPSARWTGGRWYLAPPGKGESTHSASRASTLQLLQLVTSDSETRDIEAMFKREPALSYHLLRLVNSVATGAGRRITSLAQAIVILGRQQLQRWLNLLLFAAGDDSPRTAMLLAHAVVRARRVELLAQAVGLDKAAQDQAFMGGLFSLLDILFGMPLDQILQPLSISAALRAALLEQRGELGTLLRIADAASRRDHRATAHLLSEIGCAAPQFNELELRAHTWMLDVLNTGGEG